MKKTVLMWWFAGVCLCGAVCAQELLPGPVVVELRQTQQLLASAREAMAKADKSKTRHDEYRRTARLALDQARAKLLAIEQRHDGAYSPFHPDITQVHDRLQELDAALTARSAADEADDDRVAVIAPAAPRTPEYWRARLRPYLLPPTDPAHDVDQYLDPHASSDPVEMERRLDIYSRAATALTEFRQAGYEAAMPLELRSMALDIEKTLQRFGLSCLQHADKELAHADGEVQRLEQFVRLQQEQLAEGKPVELLDRTELQQLEAVVARSARLVQSQDACLLDVRERLAGLKQSDARLRRERASEMRLKPDVYQGTDRLAVQQAAVQIAVSHKPGVRALRTSLISPAWLDETVVEWADDERAQIQPHAIRRQTAHVAVRDGGETWRYTVEVRQSRLPSGMWGAMTGHVQFADPMLEENLP